MGSSLVAAYSGLALLAVSLILSLRSRRLAAWCGGLPRQLRLHHGAALTACVLVMTHVTFEIVSVAEVSSQMLVSWELWSDPAMAWGLVALMTLVLVGFLAFWSRLHHRSWLALHRLGLLAVALAWLHACWFAVASPGFGGVRLAILALAACAVALACTALFWVVSQRRLTLAGVQCLGGQLWELLLDPKPLQARLKALEYPAGSLVDLKFLNPMMSRAWHPFSVASCRKERYLRLIIRSCGRDTNLLSEVQSGDSVDVRGPFESHGILARTSASRDEWQVWLGAGVGVAPFVGLLHCRGVLDLGPTCFVHFDRSGTERALVQDICERISQTSGVKAPSADLIVRSAYSDDAPQQSVESVVGRLAGEFPGARFRLCGPPGFLRAASDALKHAGVPGSKIMKEDNFR